MDWDKVRVLLDIIGRLRELPKLRGLHDAAMAALEELNGTLAQKPLVTMPKPVPAPLEMPQLPLEEMR